jgi:hypothetical protein
MFEKVFAYLDDVTTVANGSVIGGVNVAYSFGEVAPVELVTEVAEVMNTGSDDVASMEVFEIVWNLMDILGSHYSEMIDDDCFEVSATINGVKYEMIDY